MLDTKKIDKKRSIGKVAMELGVQTHVIRFWESKFPQIKPQIGAGNRRYYFNKDLQILKKIKSFLYDDGYTISGLQKLLKKQKIQNSKITEFGIDDFMGHENEIAINEKDIIKPNKNINKNQINNLINNIESNLDDFQNLLSKI